MISRSLVSQIENQSDQLARIVVEKVGADPKIAAYKSLTEEDKHRAVAEVLGNLGSWLNARSESAIENLYRKLGMRRRHGGIPQSQVVRTLHIVQQTVFDFIRTSVLADPKETGLEADLALAIAEFFDSAVYGVALGYEAAEPNQSPSVSAANAAAAAYEPAPAAPPEDVDWDPTSRAGEIGEVSG